VLGEIVNWALRRRRVYRVRGDSMEPLLRDGEYVLVDPGATGATGDIVVSRHPFKDIDVVKHIESINGGLVTLWSPKGTHSRHFGRVPQSSIAGTVTVSLSRRRRLDQADRAPIASRGSTYS
jgi:phage repressor protein C with HTH and peptisase S24 domain